MEHFTRFSKAVSENAYSCRNPARLPSKGWFVCRLAAVFFLVLGFASAQPERQKMDAFAKCLAQKNAIMYGSYFCSHCDSQRELFGESFKFIHYVECSRMGSPQDVNACRFAQIRYTPTWGFASGERLVGLQTLKTLSDKTGCKLP